MNTYYNSGIKIDLQRTKQTEHQTTGTLTIHHGPLKVFHCVSLELPWNDNLRNVSCIPAGIYPMRFEYSPNFKTDLWELKEVPNRSQILIHPANYVEQLRGCIALGKKLLDINGDGSKDITSSKDTIAQFQSVLKDLENETVHIHIADILIDRMFPQPILN